MEVEKEGRGRDLRISWKRLIVKQKGQEGDISNKAVKYLATRVLVSAGSKITTLSSYNTLAMRKFEG